MNDYIKKGIQKYYWTYMEIITYFKGNTNIKSSKVNLLYYSNAALILSVRIWENN